MKKLLVILLLMGTFFNANAKKKSILVAYFSCTGTTETVARTIAKTTGADLYRITPKLAYTDADLDWHNKESRSSVEMANPKSRPELADRNANIEAYDLIVIGYPIWWYTCPTIINSFLEAYNFKGKTIIPFATSGGSSISRSEKELRALYNHDIDWKLGKLLNGNEKQIAEWAKTIL